MHCLKLMPVKEHIVFDKINKEKSYIHVMCCRSKVLRIILEMNTELSLRMLTQWKSSGCDSSDDRSKPNKIVVTPRGSSALTCKLLYVINRQLNK